MTGATLGAGAPAAGVPATGDRRTTSVAEVDLDAVAANVGRLRRVAGTAQVMAVVKADAYGHGVVPVARAAVRGGATWLGTAQLSEALQLRAAGLSCRVMSWLHLPDTDYPAAVRADIDLSASARWSLEAIAAAAEQVGGLARVHLCADTGMGREGATVAQWRDLVEHALRLQAAGAIAVVGVWSHLACADEPDHPSVRAQHDAFTQAVAVAERAGARLEVRHLANSAATLTRPSAHFDLVRAGLATYGLSPAPSVGDSGSFGLRPAMTLRTWAAQVKRVPAGQGVSYGLTYTTDRETQLVLVPVGYGDGVPRAASGCGPLLVRGRRQVVAGRVCMDQLVVDVGPDPAVRVGDQVVLFGSDGPTAQDWAEASGTISWEIVARIGARVPRVYRGSHPEEAA